MLDHLERELKLDAAADFSLTCLAETLGPYTVGPARVQRLHTYYYDTPDRRLSRWGCSLRFRVGEGWTLKLSVSDGAAALRRSEHGFLGELETVPATALDLATPFLRGAAVARVAELRTMRTSRDARNADGDAVAEITEDDVRILTGSQVRDRFRQVEIELGDAAHDDALDELAALLRERGAGPPKSIPKDVRAVDGDPRDVELAPPKVGRHATMLDVTRASLSRAVERIVRSDAAIRLAHDAEAVHKARTSVRRLRSNLRTFEPVFDSAYARGLGERLRWLGDALGEARDADVLLARVGRDARALSPDDAKWTSEATAALRLARETAYVRLVHAMRQPRYVELLDDLVVAAMRPQQGAAALACARDIGPPLLDGAWRGVRKRVRKRSRPPTDTDLHGIRIKAKYVRYAAEALAPVLGRCATRLAKAAERLQTVLGDQHDATIAANRLSEPAEGGRSVFVAGELAQRERDAAEAGRSAWREAWRDAKRRHAAIAAR
ncbi:MAG: CHAD domain-containing protein [Candidatus Eremiobacteraeota bacterium]|nr:CHAD domain-containing protein [Candidatus Eremiobacteraeota bacterium]MBC5803115.1 CHAD domain-containing protein [Candidatus Eremiobacteraeota bacterium]MBC5821286.1 CHAD domain-containing protein [Candidatus Eremiobacteraeota bacterium]